MKKPARLTDSPTRPTEVVNGRRVQPVQLPWHDAVRRGVRLHRCTLMVGNPGSGKTTLARTIARELTGQEPETLQGGPGTDRGTFWGSRTVRGGELAFEAGHVTAALTEGRVLLIEELQAIPVEFLAEVLCLRGSAEVTNPITRERHAVPDSFRLIATANHASLQCRRHGAILQAFVDDFMVHVIPDPTAEQLGEVLRAQFPGAPAKLLERAIELWEEYRGLARDGKHAGARFSVRAAMHLVTRLLDGEDEDAAVDGALVGKYVFDDDLHQTARLRLQVGIG